ncbi:acetyl-CoA carboxylase biotin carboxyl carrier protein [Sphaerisporangium sp. TRM90804]|uniref:acetyl-CoA carboxylase biotin carboxyl carrier protein n=1 Tax=Sphaerisporangium sp. TRM90804 TaxID=3031113 RepID=UPI00244C2DC4|nr:acetyl-CoA carboxylase biotin carboxyl carrier protein [Sphaerisporangium sp. TRM90804]MDH2427235.1 acetyl-CoA carboxylase biotin carboxyl carrier protein [Sphaerisporangium sp. TRM90804]
MPDEHSSTGPADQAEALVHQVTRLLDGVPGPVRRIRLQVADASLEMEWQDGAHVAQPVADRPAADEPPEGLGYVRAPMVGTFYRAATPGVAPFVNVGDEIQEGQQVAILEAMKLMNEVQADRHGRIVEILVLDGTPVEYDQPLFVVTSADSVS